MIKKYCQPWQEGRSGESNKPSKEKYTWHRAEWLSLYPPSYPPLCSNGRESVDRVWTSPQALRKGHKKRTAPVLSLICLSCLKHITSMQAQQGSWRGRGAWSMCDDHEQVK